jgi:hypothetical protein
MKQEANTLLQRFKNKSNKQNNDARLKRETKNNGKQGEKTLQQSLGTLRPESKWKLSLAAPIMRGIDKAGEKRL